MSRPRVLLADDHTIFLDALTKLLEPEFEVVGTVNDGRALVSQAPDLRPDVVVLDIGMPLRNGLDAGQQIKEMRPEIKLIFLTQNQDANIAADAFRRKASGYLLKNSAATELITAIREAMKGRTYVSPLIAEEMLSIISDPTRAEKRVELTFASAGSIAASGRGQIDERGREHLKRQRPHDRIPQAAPDGNFRPENQCGSRPLCSKAGSEFRLKTCP